MSQKLFHIVTAVLAAVFMIAGAIIRIPLKADSNRDAIVHIRGISQAEILTGNDTDYHGYPTELLPGTMININTASVDELQQLSGIGPSLAEAIDDYRKQNGPFSAIEDIMLVKGIAEGKFAGICDYITVGDN